MKKSPFPVILVDDHQVFCDALSHLLEETKTVKVAGRASGRQDLIPLLRRIRPRLVLLDVVLKNEENGLNLIPLIRRISPKSLILVCTTFEDPVVRQRAMAWGANGFFAKSGDFRALLKLVNDLIEKDNSSPFTIPSAPTFPLLTEMESKVVRLLREGKSQKEIAHSLGISIPTVATHILRARKKTGMSSTSQLVSNAFLFLSDA